MAIRLIGAAIAALLLAACGTSLPTASSQPGRVRVVAAENFWGSLAAQVGGEHASVTSIIANPDTDPHVYEATPGDARAIATAQYVIANGAGYDAWVQKLADANPVAGRRLLVVGDLFARKQGDNPHLWYSPSYVSGFIDRVAADLGGLDAADAAYFTAQAAQLKTVRMKAYFDAIATIKQRYAGTRVGATESVFAYLAADTGLDLITPAGYMKSISEGADPSAADKAEVQREIAGREIKVLVFNSQNSTPDVLGLVGMARAAGIAVLQITETLTPRGATFQDWQTRQLEELLQALGG
jgi:zinc/manganese transport system substrate-binding protein